MLIQVFFTLLLVQRGFSASVLESERDRNEQEKPNTDNQPPVAPSNDLPPNHDQQHLDEHQPKPQLHQSVPLQTTQQPRGQAQPSQTLIDAEGQQIAQNISQAKRTMASAANEMEHGMMYTEKIKIKPMNQHKKANDTKQKDTHNESQDSHQSQDVNSTGKNTTEEMLSGIGEGNSVTRKITIAKYFPPYGPYAAQQNNMFTNPNKGNVMNENVLQSGQPMANRYAVNQSPVVPSGAYFPGNREQSTPATSIDVYNDKTQHMIETVNEKVEKVMLMAKKPENVHLMIHFPKFMEEHVSSIFEDADLHNISYDFKELMKLYLRDLFDMLRTETNKSENPEFLPIVQDVIGLTPTKRQIFQRRTPNTRFAVRLQQAGLDSENTVFGIPVIKPQLNKTTPSQKHDEEVHKDALSTPAAHENTGDSVDTHLPTGGAHSPTTIAENVTLVPKTSEEVSSKDVPIATSQPEPSTGHESSSTHNEHYKSGDSSNDSQAVTDPKNPPQGTSNSGSPNAVAA